MIRNADMPTLRRDFNPLACASGLRLTALLLLCTIFSSLSFAQDASQEGSPYLITDISKVNGLTGASDSTLDPEATDDHSEATLPKDASFIVELDNPITLTTDKGLVVMFGRWSNEGSPKATMVEGSTDGTNWDILGYSYMQFRGGEGTIEYSKPIYVNEASKDKSYTHLKFTVLKTALGYASGDLVRFNKFNIFLLAKGELYPDGRIDPWRLNTDYYTTYQDYKFEPTRGVLDPRNHYGKNINYPTETPWGDNNTFYYEGREYELPTFKMQGGNQMPHVTEHTVYAMPGEIIPLLPFYDMPRNSRYYAKFSHWYLYNADKDGEPQPQNYSHVIDETTGERLLDFLIDPAGIFITDEAGFFGGNALPKEVRQFVIRTEADLIEFARLVREENETSLNAVLANDIEIISNEFNGIGGDDVAYAGVFNGNGHTISNLNLTGNGPLGFFRKVASGFSIKNLILSDCSASGSGNVGIVIGEVKEGNWGTTGTVNVSNVKITGDVDLTGYGIGGSLVGKVGGNMIFSCNNIVYEGSIFGAYNSAALVGRSDSQVSLENCFVDAYVQKYESYSWDGNGFDGSVVNASNDRMTFTNCMFNVYTSSSIDGVKTFAKQTGLNDEFGYSWNHEDLVSSDKDPHSFRIYVAKDMWSDFVLLVTQNNNVNKTIVGSQGSEIIQGKEYLYFEPHMGEYDWFGYSIVPYTGEASLNELSWISMPGIQPICVVETENLQRREDEFVRITVSDYIQRLEENSVFSQWKMEDGDYIPPMKHVADEDLKTNLSYDDKYLFHQEIDDDKGAQSWYGTVATFFKPYDTSAGPDAEVNQKLGTHSFDIAADFSHEFEPESEKNLDNENKTVYSPIINYRHIFHVVSGKDFADEYTGSKEANEKYLATKKRVVYAMSGKMFQLRLPGEFPVPVASNSKYSSTNFYYKAGEKLYDRARSFGIEVLKDGDPYDNNGLFIFEPDPRSENGMNESQGSRKYQEGGVEYFTAGGNDVVHRMLQCNNPEKGTFTVRIYAQDDTNNPVYIWNDETKQKKIYMMEYEITFLDNDEASLIEQSSIKEIEAAAIIAVNSQYLHTDKYLQNEDVCGDPAVFLNYDEYRAFEDEDPDAYFITKDETADKSLKYYKWPTIWSQCSYSHGYGGYLDYNYNEYMIANHASQILWGSSAQGYSNNPDGTTGLYDRLYYDTNGEDKGYFYYVNAASDPGVISRLRIDRLCMGSTVVVTAWVAEFSDNTEKANVAFNFTAVMKDGSRQRLHTFVTGYVETSGSWNHVYYSFVPELPENSEILISEIDHYEIEVENNCKSSAGADYAVDDIRAYIVTPEIRATQLSPMCDNEASSTGIQLRTRFDKLLTSQGIVELEDDDETGETEVVNDEDMCTVYMAMFDKARYDADLANENVSMSETLANSVVKLEDENHVLQEWISFKMNKNFAKLTEFDPDDSEKYYLTALGATSAKGVNYLIANIKPDGTNIQVGKRYLVSIRLVDGSVANAKELTLEDFAVSEDDCAKYGVLTLQGSGIVKVDGFAYTTDEEIEVCAGQVPVLQVELLKVGDGRQTVSTEKYYYDWFLGPMDGMSDEEFMQLTNFRIAYKDATEIPVADRRVPGFEDVDDEGYAVLVGKYSKLASLVKQGVLFLHQSSFVFPEISSDPDFNKNLVVTAFPIIDEQKEEGEKVCGGASEIRLVVNDASPKMYDGFSTIEYPGYMTDVPLRVGLRQLREVSTKVTAEALGIDRRLQVPLRAITSYKGDDSDATMQKREKNYKGEDSDPFVYIVETNDPAYKTLTKHPGNSLVDSSLELTVKDESGVILGLLPAGLVTGMTAVKGGEGNAVNIVFSKDMQFREGYYYKMRFDFDETLDESSEATGYCSGQTVFTIKVVPEYQQWTGDAGRNWNNDGNWRRVAKSELFLKDTDTKIGVTYDEDGKEISGVLAADHTTDEGGNNTNRMSYAPMDFTKVIVPKGVKKFPLMFERNRTDVVTLQGSRKWDNVDADKDAAHHDATKDIKYDMASLSLDNVLACRPWYANTCEEIHFQYGAELQRQQWFAFGDNYQKAWVDLETQPNRWYTLATPLKQVVAGDMYTISEGSKQNTELFKDINFDNKYYGRFDPAVYQRSWNRAGEAELYELDETNSHTDASEGISLNWSHTYNQVDVDYSGGHGFSIKTVPQSLEDGENADNTVRFRLPKADDSYSYFDVNDKTENLDDKSLETRADRHILNTFPMEVKLEAKNESQYFLTGNPFIARMDMAKFFKGNPGLSGKYWIMSGDRQDAYLWKGDGEEFISTAAGDDPADVVAPMQGFFVEANDAAKDLTLNLTADMIKVTDGEGAAGPLKIGRRADDVSMMRIVAVVDDEELSSAVICLDAEADAAYDETEDAAMIVDRSLGIPTAVYTSASGRALAINSLDRIERTEVGVAADPETRTLLRFEGVDEGYSLKLLDTATGESLDLYDGMVYGVEGSSAGRLYIVRSVEGPEVAEVAVMLCGRTVNVAAPADGIVARAFDAGGTCLGEWTSTGCSLSFEVASGVILIEVTADGRALTRKFIVK